MKHELKEFVLGLILISFIISSSGCVALVVGAAAGAGGVSYYNGRLVQNVDAPMKKVHQETLKALKDLGMFTVKDEETLHRTRTISEFEDGKNVTIVIDALTEKASKITIRVGVWGDQPKSQTILDKIMKGL